MATNKKGFYLSIFNKVLLTMLVVALIPFGGLWYFDYLRTSADTQGLLDLKLKATAESLAIKADDWVDLNLRVLKQNGNLADITAMDTGRHDAVFKTVADTYPWAYLVFSVAPDGTNIGRSDGKPKKQYGDRQYFKDVMAGQAVAKQLLIGRTTGKPALVLASPIGKANQRLGVIAMAMHLTDITETVANIKVGDTGYVMLLDKSGKLIASGGNSGLAETLQDLSDHPALHQKAAQRAATVYQANGKQVVGFTRKTRYGWTLIVQQDYDEAFAPMRQAQQEALIIMGAGVVLVLLMAYLLASGLSKPIRQLTLVADNISRGKMGERVVAKDRHDEIGELARSVERMRVSLKTSLERLRRKSNATLNADIPGREVA